MSEIRRQATLFLRGNELVDRIRKTYNPAQYALIDSHVTLCREDEVDDWDILGQKLVDKKYGSVTLEFGKPRHRDGFVYLPCIGPTSDFDRLRDAVLSDPHGPPRKHIPHITLIHPRNGVCSRGEFEDIEAAINPFSFTFDEVSFIAQTAGGVWQILETFRLARALDPLDRCSAN